MSDNTKQIETLHTSVQHWFQSIELTLLLVTMFRDQAISIAQRNVWSKAVQSAIERGEADGKDAIAVYSDPRMRYEIDQQSAGPIDVVTWHTSLIEVLRSGPNYGDMAEVLGDSIRRMRVWCKRCNYYGGLNIAGTPEPEAIFRNALSEPRRWGRHSALSYHELPARVYREIDTHCPRGVWNNGIRSESDFSNTVARLAPIADPSKDDTEQVRDGLEREWLVVASNRTDQVDTVNNTAKSQPLKYSRGEWQIAALRHLADNPNASNREIAKVVGRSESTVSGDPKFKQLRAKVDEFSQGDVLQKMDIGSATNQGLKARKGFRTK